MKKQFLTIAICSFLGGLAGSIVFSSTASLAAKEEHLYLTNFHNDNGNRIAVIAGAKGTGEGQLFLFNDNGKTEIQMGAYSKGMERGQTLFGMHDRFGYLRLLMRMHGPEDSPTVVMKDNTGKDRIVFGLDGTTQTPYFKYTNDRGEMVNLF
ncbi:MAG: hypothetical protein R3E13_05105 [Alphaproteobacteria bacterium]